VLLLLEGVRRGEIIWVSSEALADEISRNKDVHRRNRVVALLELASEMVDLSESDKTRAQELCKLGFKTYDAIHLTAAERAKCDAFLTTDDRLLSRADRIKTVLRTRVLNPIDFARGLRDENKRT
jgi:predicted nucleic acid-binding protein